MNIKIEIVFVLKIALRGEIKFENINFWCIIPAGIRGFHS
jgi:hypothetical protein